MTKKNDFRWSEEQKNTEQDILEGRYSSVKDLSAEKDKLTQIVANNKARKQINIRIKNGDLLAIQKKAASLGMPYQTLINSILHQYAVGKDFV